MAFGKINIGGSQIKINNEKIITASFEEQINKNTIVNIDKVFDIVPDNLNNTTNILPTGNGRGNFY